MPNQRSAPEAAPRRPAARPRRTVEAGAAPDQLELEFVRFGPRDKALDLRVDLGSDTIWATQAQMAEMFGVGAAAVSKELSTLKGEGGLGTVRPGSAGSGDLYDLDTILCVGYRVSSGKAAAFRRWASQTLRASAVDGFALNEARLRDDPAASDRLATRLRAIRADETNIYETVRAFFRQASQDHDDGAPAARQFHATLTDKFVYAVTGSTPSDLILARADHGAPNMGLTRVAGDAPSVDEARIASNYLDGDEIYALHVLCEQFLLYVQGQAARSRVMTMRELAGRLDDLLRFDDYPVLPGHKDVHRERAVRHAGAEYARFVLRDPPKPRLGRR
ncbi:hypothetical protein D3273_10710 [Lichenibacterium minor]|uniref:Bro-N domain-containing protein n=1 Tax=Lichenibacterium minor TaxID=2316528 RepID=A0A4Q2U7L0_9HYPH|nr:RhuM family protein [Lichenibacterium minor]RYC31898.1 hypothetical protein D3273_10710 [Lichenibacterium minor]